MRLLFWLSYAGRSLARSGRRGLFAAICVAVGIAGVVALQIAASTVQNALTSNVRAANGGDISLATESSPLSRQDLAVFRTLEKQGRITIWTALSRLHGTAVGTNRDLVPFDIQVVSVPPYPLGGDPTFVSPGNGHVASLLTHSGDILISSILAQELGVGVGSHLLVNSVGGRGLHVVVRGVLSQTSFEHAAIMTVEHRDAGILTNRPLTYSAVYANVSGSPNGVAALLRSDFPTATVQTVSEALAQDEAQVHDFRQFLLLVGLLALLIAGIGTLNAIQSMLVRRRLEIAMLKAMGFGQTTLYALFGGEALLLGLAGGIVGTAVGVAVSKFITDTVASALGLQVSLVVDPGTLAGGVALGIGSALVFAVLPITRAAGYRPLELLREGATTAWRQWPQTLALLVLVMTLFSILAAVTLNDLTLAVELVILAFVICGFLTGLFSVLVGWIGLFGRPTSRPAGVLVLAGLIVVTVLAAARIPAIAAILALAALLWALAVVLPEHRLLPLVVATRSLGRRRGRTSVTLVAFLAGVLAMSLTLTVAISLRGQINDALSTISSTNLVAIANSSSERAVLSSARKLPGVHSESDLSVIQTNAVAINGLPLVQVIGPSRSRGGFDREDTGRLLGGVTGYDLRAGDGPSQIRMVSGRPLGPQDAGTSNGLVRSDLLNPPFSLSVGDRITLQESGTGTRRAVTVVGFYARQRRGRGFRGVTSLFTPPVFTDRSFVRRLGGADTQVVITFSIDPSQLTSDASNLQRAAPGALVVDIGDLAAIVDQILNELLDVLAVITALVLGAGVAVVANGVALAMLERRRELALFKAIGFGPGSVLRFVLLENALIGTMAGAVSVLAVAVTLALISRFALQRAIGFDPLVAILVLGAATALAVITAYLTARGPVRIRPLEALRNE